MPEAIPLKCPRMTDRGAAARENGLLKSMNAVGPSAGKTRGKPVCQARRLTVKIASAPFAPDMSEMTLRSSHLARRDGIDNLARQVSHHMVIDMRRLLVGITVLPARPAAADEGSQTLTGVIGYLRSGFSGNWCSFQKGCCGFARTAPWSAFGGRFRTFVHRLETVLAECQ